MLENSIADPLLYTEEELQEMRRQMYGGWDHWEPFEVLTLVGNNRLWGANPSVPVRVNWVKEGF